MSKIVSKKFKNGFTLIELLVVIAVVGVLAGAVIAIINPGAQLARARDAQRKNDLRVIQQALEEYRVVNGRFPQAGNSVGGTCAYNPNCYVYSYQTADWIQALTPYLKKIPRDPKNSGCCPWTLDTTNYTYSYGNVYQDGQIYDLDTKLESPNDPDRCELKNYKFYHGGVICVAFGGDYSNQLYDREP